MQSTICKYRVKGNVGFILQKMTWMNVIWRHVFDNIKMTSSPPHNTHPTPPHPNPHSTHSTTHPTNITTITNTNQTKI